MTATNAKCDAELCRAAIDGGPEAFSPIVERYRDAVFGIALARLRDFHDAEDMAQHVFVEAFERLGGLRDPARLGPWLRSVAIHRCIDRLRRRREKVGVEPCQVPSDARAEPPAELERRELREQVLAAIGRLGKAQRETTTLFYINGYSVAEVAGLQEVPAGTVKRRLHDAREKLKEQLIGMVENVLKSEAPKEDFAGRVFELLCYRQRPRHVTWAEWEEMLSEIERIGSRGIEGFVEALRSPHSPTRACAVLTLNACRAPETRERVVSQLKGALKDPNKKVRRTAMRALMTMDVDRERRIHEFLPLASELLTDRSNRVRRVTASQLWDYAEHVPLDRILRGYLMDHGRPRRAWTMERLLRGASDPERV